MTKVCLLQSGRRRPGLYCFLAVVAWLVSSQPLFGAASEKLGQSKAELAAASRFLSHATLGADIRLIREVEQTGAAPWIEQQFQAPIGLHLPVVQFYFMNAGGFEQTVISPTLYPRLAWWQQAMAGPDPVRQRIALALSEIFVISERFDRLFRSPDGRASYYDVLLRNAFGNYRDLLMDVTRHPAMGMYLSHLNNRKSDPAIGRFPDENYAREVMQLFSIGLFELNVDGSRKLDAEGRPIPTYDNDDITEFAKIFTGLGPDGPDDAFGREVNFDATAPMRMYDEWHEPGEKKLLSGAIVPAGQTGLQDLEDAVTILFEHPNVGPFFGRFLIQRLVTSNPSPEYIARVASKFNDNGSGVRGDMQAVIRAILLDLEASGENAGPHYGRLQEPFVRYVALCRMFRASSESGLFLNSGFYADFYLDQHAGASPSVFNFFLPDYRPSGPIGDAGLVAPEFQITTDSTLIGMANLVTGVTLPGTPMTSPLGEQLLECARGEATCDHIPEWLLDDTGRNVVRLDLSEEEKVGDDINALLDHLDIVMTYGTLSDSTREALVPFLTAAPSVPHWRARLAISLLMMSPDYVVAN